MGWINFVGLNLKIESKNKCRLSPPTPLAIMGRQRRAKQRGGKENLYLTIY
jgi:hypothetical protein